MSSSDQLCELLAEVPLFAGLDAADRSALVKRAVLRQFRKGQVLFVEGDSADWLAIVVAGRLKVSVYSLAGGELLLATVEAGEAVGELGVLTATTRSATAEALTDGAALHMPRAAVDELLAVRPQVAVAMLATLASLIRQTTGTAADLVFLDLPRRVAKYLVEHVDVDLTQGQLAARLGASRQRVNGVLGDFERRGWIVAVGSHLTVRDRAALQRLLGG